MCGIMKPICYSSCNSTTKRFPRTLLSTALVILLSLVPLGTSCTQKERSSLLHFVSELSQDGGLRSSWENTTMDCCNWEGITCSSEKTVTDVFLACRSLEGQVSVSLGNLTSLLRLTLSHNSLYGDLPLELFSSRIIVLDVSFNSLSGDLSELPSSTPGQPLQVLNISSNLYTGQFTSAAWKGMGNLVALNASNNSFTGNIPTHFCDISPSFAVLELSYNHFSGTVPQGLGNCSMLRVLKAGHNNLSGKLPDELYNATLMEYLSFPDNYLHGVLDGERIINLRNLVTLDLGGNSFSGRISASVGQLKRLEELHLDYSNMYRELPSTLSNCTNLITIDLQGNTFSGGLNKVNFSNLPNLRTLDLLLNNFSGTIPESIYSCKNLTALRLAGNKFHGQLSGLGNLKSLSFLSLTNNSFSNITNALQVLRSSKNLNTLLLGINFFNEIMPDDDTIDGFENLQFLAIQKCLLSGKIPLWISKLANLEILILDDNRLSGPIPTGINTLNYLFYVDISNNSLTGEIPTALMNLPMLSPEKTAMNFDVPIYAGPSMQYHMLTGFPKVLYLNNNKFTGVIPPEIGQLKALLYLDISFNSLTGPIPPSICNLTNLQALDLSNNNLTGTIPAALENLHFLSTFNVSDNNLEGPIPTGGQFSTFQNSSFVGNPKLCGPMLDHHCNSTERGPVSIVYSKPRGCKLIFAIAFGVFFVVGVLYNQMVLSRYLGLG